MAFLVKFWGTRGSIPTPSVSNRKYGGNTACVEIRVGDALFICDGGTGLRELGLELQRRADGPIRANFLFSHAHWDHIQGFPFFVPVYSERNHFRVFGTHHDDDRFYQLLSGQMKSEYFPVAFQDLGSDVEAASLEAHGGAVDGVHIRWFAQTHPGGSYAYAFERDGIKVVYATDHEYDLDFPDPAAVEADLDAPRPIDPAFLEFIRGADLLVTDSQYLDDEYPSHRGWGHPRASTALDVAVQGGCARLALFHHDPMHTDDIVDDKVERCRARAARFGSDLVVFGAREGMALRLDV